MLKVGIIEDTKDYRELLVMLFEGQKDIEVVFASDSAEAAMVMIKAGNLPEVCIVDIQLPGKSGIDFLNWKSRFFPGIFCVMCTAYDTDDKIFSALKAGAHGYLLKSTAPEDIIKGVKDMAGGGSPMSSEIARKVVTSFKSEPDYSYGLSMRETEVVELLAKGLLYKEIAFQLAISVETVRRHCFNIYEKLHVENRTEAVNKYFRNNNT